MSIEGSELVKVEAEDVISELRRMVEFVHWRDPTYGSTFSCKEKKLNELVEAASNPVYGHIVIENFIRNLAW